MRFYIYCTTRVNVISTKCQHAEGLVRALIDSPNWVGLQLCYVHPSIPFKRPLFSVELCVRDALWSHWLPIVCRGALLSCSFVMTVGQPLYRLNKITQLFIWGPNPSTCNTPHQPPNRHLEKPLKPPKTTGHSLSLNTSQQLKKLDQWFSTSFVWENKILNRILIGYQI